MRVNYSTGNVQPWEIVSYHSGSFGAAEMNHKSYAEQQREERHP